ncbi:MAG: metal ABC transporter permease [Planctomycetaceae bacterium]|nr:metal ABC transporter permease [Planctomycetaceae bacterium]
MGALFDVLQYPFVLRAVTVGVLVALSAALLGVILTLKKFTLIGHGLSDVGFASLTIGLVLGLPPLLFAGPAVVAAAVVMMLVSQHYRTSGDIAIGIASTGALALGIIVAAAGPGINMDVHNYMFGSILSVDRLDVVLASCLALVVAGTFIVLHNRLFLVTYDEPFARTAGVNVAAYHLVVSVLTALTVVVGMRMVGTLLISGLIIFPAITARNISTSYKGMVATAAAVSVVGCLIGMAASLATNWPAGASIVAVNILLYLASFVWRRVVG